MTVGDLDAKLRAIRVAVHIAVMARHDIRRIMSFDRGFDTYPGIERLHWGRAEEAHE